MELITLNAGIIKSTTGLIIAQNQLENIEKIVNDTFQDTFPQTDLYEMKNLLTIAQLIVNQSLNYITIPQKNTKKKILHTQL